MLHNTFFKILKEEPAEGAVKALLSIDKDHAILKGHFPGQPVVPGVCMMQIVKALVERQTKRNLRLATAENMKFLSVIDPRQHQEVEASVSFSENNGVISLNASLFSGSVTFFKLKATLQNVQ
ncbi:3-hydroxyacyl-ACP dehydratase [Fulvivirgaceae bacterium PWU4]|uniref:3-hydroxyacyl-ACP dehydratase n=1 Tax=Chryseosolibacter histidini TaxID=2782349 RepID=A0AAP2GKU7_9BACT|nr:3-hydroxyacyl-ACP dehydratase [Chryseosolibacter histidini]MBT1699711.1 3-hydroxyacyl-ACP dehydratase [Chryseosolibacter histidini]